MTLRSQNTYSSNFSAKISEISFGYISPSLFSDQSHDSVAFLNQVNQRKA